jgi:electron transport complex protein RnfA
MAELLLIVLGAALVNNFVLVQLLGLCPAFAASQRLDGAVAMGLGTGLVLATTAGLAQLVERYLLAPFDVEYLRLVAFVVLVGLAVWLTKIMVRRFSPVLERLLGAYVPLLASNCAVLGVAWLNATASRSFVAALFFGAGAALGLGLALALLAGLRERLAFADVPMAFRGAPIAFVTAGILSLAFLAFAGFARL